MPTKTLVACALVALGTTAACSANESTLSAVPSATGGGEIVVGVVVAVDGGLAGIDSFTIRVAGGAELRFVPAPDVMFDGVAPLGHLRDHLMSGDPVQVAYETRSGGELVAIRVADAAGAEAGRGE